MENQNRPPKDNSILTFSLLMLLGLIMWGLAAFVWWRAYIWFAWVTEPTFIVTFLAIPIPFMVYRGFQQATNPGPTAPPSEDFVTWLGRGEPYRGAFVFAIFIFWSILYWSLDVIEFNALTFASWGLLTIFGMFIIRQSFQPPSRGVSAVEATKSQPK